MIRCSAAPGLPDTLQQSEQNWNLTVGLFAQRLIVNSAAFSWVVFRLENIAPVALMGKTTSVNLAGAAAGIVVRK
jgi:hypothetical protein